MDQVEIGVAHQPARERDVLNLGMQGRRRLQGLPQRGQNGFAGWMPVAPRRGCSRRGEMEGRPVAHAQERETRHLLAPFDALQQEARP